MSAILAICWVSCSFLSMAFSHGCWHKNFGDYDDYPITFWVIDLFLGPIALLASGLMCLANSASPRFDWFTRHQTVHTSTLSCPRDAAYPSTFGWRTWIWDINAKVLISPQIQTPWPDPELRCVEWDTSTVLRGAAGIHARFVPTDWEHQTTPEAGMVAGHGGGGVYVGAPVHYQPVPLGGHAYNVPIIYPPLTQQNVSNQMQQYNQAPQFNPGTYQFIQNAAVNHGLVLQSVHYRVSTPISGIVERFGKYVLGTDGWRAEHVIIRKLLAPTTEIGLELERVYPDVEVIYADQLCAGRVR